MAVNWWEEDDPEGYLAQPSEYEQDYQNLYGENPRANQRPASNTPPPAMASLPTSAPKTNVMGFNPNTAMAERFKGIAQDYKAGRAESFDRLGQNMPQQFGQAETKDNSDEGPLTPEETAARLPTEIGNRYDKLAQPGTMEQLIRQHTLGFRIPRASKEGYNNYVEASRAADDQRRNAQRERARVNQGAIGQRDELTMRQLADYNRAITGGGGAGESGGESPSIGRVGGIGLLRGHWRPQTTQEAAETDLTRAQAGYYRSRPEIAEAGIRQKADAATAALSQRADVEAGKAARSKAAIETRLKIAQDHNQTLRDISEARKSGDPVKLAQAAAAVGNKIGSIAQILKIKLQAAQQPRGIPFMKSPDPRYRDATVNPLTKEVGDPVEGDFDFYKNALKNEITALAEIDPNAQLPEDVMTLLENIKG